MVVIWEGGKDVCGVLHADSDVYAALIPKVQIATHIRGEIETDVLYTGGIMKWWNMFKYYLGVCLLLDQRAGEDICSAACSHLRGKKEILIIDVICIIKKKVYFFTVKWFDCIEIIHSDAQINIPS